MEYGTLVMVRCPTLSGIEAVRRNVHDLICGSTRSWLLLGSNTPNLVSVNTTTIMAEKNELCVICN